MSFRFAPLASAMAVSILAFVAIGVMAPVAACAAAPAPAGDKPFDPLADKVAPPPQPIAVPADLDAKLSGLSPEQVAFLRSGKSRRIVDPELMFRRFREMTPQQITAYVEALESVQAQIDFKPGRDKAAIALDSSAPDFNAWKVVRPAILNPKREPGPIALSRYVGGWGTGFATFADAPVALTLEDLRAGKVEVAIVGAPLDMGSGFRDAKEGPAALRTAMGAQAPWGLDMYSMIDPTKDLRIADYGDIAIDNLSTDRSVAHVREEVAAIARTGAIPIVVGGDHSLEYPDVAAMADVYGKGKIGVVHFDSHYDAGSDRVHLIDHGQPVYRVIHEGHVLGRNYVQVGLRARIPDAPTFKWMRNEGMRYHTMVDVEKRGWEAVMNDAVAEAREGTDKLWISFDIDSLDPAFMPGTGTPVPGGLTMREAQPIVRRLCAENNIVGMDLVEVAPYLDTSYKTALNSDFLINACLSGIAMRKKGLTKPHWLSPLSSSYKGALGPDGVR
ncbi:agmatinase family protein [Gluconacetobacter sp. Hr-1-5]|uniref:agmatinase family protein n=1 Tax=Gluconacetobacter sp. Hr-1-5 TaxID=3395370 RepID=UPI003B51C276